MAIENPNIASKPHMAFQRIELLDENGRVNVASFLILAFSYSILIHFLFDYGTVWMQPENLWNWKPKILSNGPGFKVSDLRLWLDWQLFEAQPRLSRPFSSIFEIVDARFRALLWQYTVPHPSLSLIYIFAFLLSPFYLFKALREFGVAFPTASFGFSFFLLSPGNLSTSIMLFRPAKALTNFFLAFFLYHFIRCEKEIPSSFTVDPAGKKKFIWLCLVLFLSLFVDETSLLLLFTMPLLFPRLILSRARLGIFTCIPVAYFVMYFWGWPYFSKISAFPQAQPDQYLFPSLSHITHRPYGLFKGLIANLLALFGDSLGVTRFSEHHTIVGQIIFFLSLAGVVGFVILLMASLIDRRISNLRQMTRRGVILMGLGILVALGVVHTFLMLICYRNVWGLYWYGSYWSVFFVFTTCLILNRIRIKSWVLMIIFLVWVIPSTYKFYYTNRAYKYYHYYVLDTHRIESIFEGDQSRFAVPMPSHSSELYQRTRKYWTDVRSGNLVPDMSKFGELHYLKIELPGRTAGVVRTDRQHR